MTDRFERIACALHKYLDGIKHADILDDANRKCYEITPSSFHEIFLDDTPRRIAFVDGGNGMMFHSPNYLLAANRVYYSLFQGPSRLKTKAKPRVDFFSFTYLDENKAYSTKLFAADDSARRRLPPESDLPIEYKYADESRLGSLARSAAEFHTACTVLEDELDRGDMLVMDGSLQTEFPAGTTYAKRLSDLAVERNVILCGLSKSSRMVTRSGESMLARVDEIARDTGYGRWYAEIGDGIDDDQGFILAVKLHPYSRYIYRFEILQKQFIYMSPDEKNSILSSLASNSSDLSIRGYPYGLVDADRFSQVRKGDLEIYRKMLRSQLSKNPEWKRLARSSELLGMHDYLNRVSS